MDDPKETLLAGFSLQSEWPGGVRASLGYAHDALDRIGGGEARLAIRKSFQWGRLRWAPQLGARFIRAELTQNDFGVSDRNATEFRPAYHPGDAVNFETGIGTFIDLSENWLVVLNGSVEWLDDSITDSPIVEDEFVLKGLLSISYIF